MGRKASDYTYRLAQLGKVIGDHSMKGGEKVIKLTIATAAVGGAVIATLAGKLLRKK